MAAWIDYWTQGYEEIQASLKPCPSLVSLPVRTLADMDEREIIALENLYGCRVIRGGLRRCGRYGVDGAGPATTTRSVESGAAATTTSSGESETGCKGVGTITPETREIHSRSSERVGTATG